LLPACAVSSGNLAVTRNFPFALARNQDTFVHSADLFCVQNLLGMVPRFPYAHSRMKRGFRLSSCSQADKLANFRRLALIGEAVKLQPMLNLSGFSDIGNFRCRSS
jgi:aconitase B